MSNIYGTDFEVDDKSWKAGYETAMKEAKQALYHRLAAEAVFLQDQMGSETIEALPISKLKAIMEIKEL